MKRITLLLTLPLLFLACNNAKKDESKAGQTEAESDTNSQEAKFVILDTVYLVNVDAPGQNNRTNVMSEPNSGSKKLYEYYIGRRLSVVEDAGDWLGILDSIEYDDYKKKLDKPIYRTVYIRKYTTGSLDKFRLKTKDMFVTVDNGESDEAEENLDFEFISKYEYEKNKKSSKKFLSQDTLDIRKKDGVIQLPCKNKTVTLRDIDTDNDSRQIHSYVGQITELNVYVVSIGYYEGGEYTFYDKTTGSNTASFDDFPALSPDKHILSIWADPYEQCTNFSLFSVDDGISPEQKYFFVNWTPVYTQKDPIPYFWGNDNAIYVKVISTFLSGYAMDLDYCWQYIRIKTKKL